MSLNSTLENINTFTATIGKIAGLFESIQTWIGKLLVFLQAFGLSESYSYVVVGILTLLSFLVLLKFLKNITKALIVGLIFWVIASILGLL